VEGYFVEYQMLPQMLPSQSTKRKGEYLLVKEKAYKRYNN
jgi:hypothetical protein